MKYKLQRMPYDNCQRKDDQMPLQCQRKHWGILHFCMKNKIINIITVVLVKEDLQVFME